MNPEQPGFAPPTPDTNPYAFIIAPPKPPKKSLLSGGGGNSFVTKIIFLVGGAVIIIVVIAIIINAVFGTKTNVTSFENIDAQQQELIRVAGGNTQASNQPVINAGLNTQLTLITQQQQLTVYLSKLGAKTSLKILNQDKSAVTDEKLKEATAANNYDSVLTQVIVQELQSYATSLKTAYDNATGVNGKKLLATDYQQIQLLLTQWSSAEQSVSTQ